jgi:formiminotetrahydrofolate cyclodeaminase
MESLGISAQANMKGQLEAIDKDTQAFNCVMACFGMPKATEEEKKARSAAIDDATKGATLVPLGVLENAIAALDLALAVAEKAIKLIVGGRCRTRILCGTRRILQCGDKPRNLGQGMGWMKQQTI